MTTVTIFKPENDDYRKNYGFHKDRQDLVRDIENIYLLSLENPSLFILNGCYTKVEKANCQLNTVDSEPILREAYEAIELCQREKTETVSDPKRSRWLGRYWGINVGDLMKIEERNEVWIVESFGFRKLGF